MRTRHSELSRFLARVHRRATAWRIAEAVGIGMGVAAGVASVLAGGLVYLERDAWPVVGITLLAGTLAGLVRGIATRPTRFQTACVADRQLNLHELLSTAVSLSDREEPWAQTIVAQADRRAKSLRVNDLLLQRLGARAWGGIGLATAMTLVLAALAGQPGASVAVARQGAEPAGAVDLLAERDDTRLRSTTTGRVTTPQREATSADRSDVARQSSSPAPGAAAAAASGNRAAPAGGQTAARSNDAGETDSVALSRTASQQFTADGVRNGSGDGRAVAGIQGQPDTKGRVMNGESPTNEISKDASSAGLAGRGPATPAPVLLDSVPDQYRDVIGAYFDDLATKGGE